MTGRGRTDAPADGGTIIVVTGMSFEVRIAAGPGVEVYSRGPGDALERRLAERLRRPCAGVISFGVAGGLDPALRPGAVIVAERVVHLSHRYDTDAAWSAALRAAVPRAVSGPLAASDQPAAGVDDKRRLHHDSGALAVDMESHIAARLALAARVPFSACRVVLDPAARELPSAALAGFGDDGRTDIGALLRVLIGQPGQIFPLLGLARDAGAARAALRAVRASVGPAYALR
ncbi:phosphorylase [Rugamonas sp.]|uniref:phosphorylase n=1 Tax=Rugamonas sp. TaxID=1926287 RepID=UPI0025EFB633|nr:phosphorylase [Rugamonas sp.]